jgi:hypothetical protein
MPQPTRRRCQVGFAAALVAAEAWTPRKHRPFPLADGAAQGYSVPDF